MAGKSQKQTRSVEPARPESGAQAPSAAIVLDQSVTAGSPNPLELLLADRTQFSAEEEAEIARVMARHSVDRDHPVIQVVVEMLLYRRGFGEVLGAMTTLLETTRAAIDATGAPPPPSSTARSKTTFALSAAVTVAIAAGVLVVALVFGVVGRAIGDVEQDAALRARAPQIARLLTTRAGGAAMQLVRDNGNALPSILSRCRRFTDHGRPAEACNLWTQGTGVPLTPMTVFDYARRSIAAFPAWPIVILMLIVAGFRFAWSKGRVAAGKARRGW